MEVSNWMIFGAAEVLAMLLLICGFLFLYARKLKKMAIRLQDKLQLALRELKKSRQKNKALQHQAATRNSYSEMVDEQLSVTKEHHQSLQPDQDIALDLSCHVPVDRQITSLRHAFLVGEKEATQNARKGEPDWDILQSKFTRVLDFIRSDTPAEADISEDLIDDLTELQQALANSEQRVANLEQFKTLFFELEEKWETTQQRAQTYQQDLQGFEVGNPDKQQTFDQLLQSYMDTYREFGEQMQEREPSTDDATAAKTEPEPEPETSGIESGEQNTSSEIARLKSVAANQHKLIKELQQRLEEAYSSQEKEAIIGDLKGQLDKQLRFVQESESCVQLLENELSLAKRQLLQLNTSLELKDQQSAENLRQAETLQQEQAQMQDSLARLQRENEHLVTQLQTAMSSASKAAGGNASKGKTSEEKVTQDGAQKELKQLQQQYIDLENKYLALRMKR